MKTRTESSTNAAERSPAPSVLLLVALLVTVVTAMPAEAGMPAVYRVIAGVREGATLQTPSETGRTGPIDVTAPLAAVTITTVDTELYTGYENAIYAADDSTVLVAYKRFLSDPTISGYIPAELRVARSTDAGQTWTITVIDPNAIEEGDTIDNSVSIDGDHGSAVYVAYHVRASGLFADMKLKVAKSTDGGSTWTTQTVADSNAGDYNSVRVLTAKAVVISAHANGPEEGIHSYISKNGGATWTDSIVAGGLGNGLYTSVGAADIRSVWVSYYNSLYPDHTDMNAAMRTRGATWDNFLVDGTPGDPNLTGLASSITVSPNRMVFAAYEADTTSGTFVRVASTTDGTVWNIVPVQQDVTIGWNTAIHEFNGKLYLSYWRVPSGGNGLAMFAVSGDNGITWTPYTIRDPRYVEPYLDSTAPSNFTQFESYQTVDPTTFQQPVLRVARIGG